MSESKQRPIQNYILAGILVLLFIAILRIIAPFFTALLWSVLLYILLSPLYRRLVKGLNFETFRGKILQNFLAGIFTIGTVLVILVPVSLVTVIFFQQALDLGHQLSNVLNERPEYLSGIFGNIADFINMISAGQISVTEDDITDQLWLAVSSWLQRVVLLGNDLARYLGTLFLSMILMTFSVFFFYVDGPYLSQLVLRAIPIKNEYITTLKAKFLNITRNLFLGYIIIAALQAFIAYIVYTIFGVQGSLVFAAITFVLVFIPGVGALLVWLPLGIIRIISGDTAGGILFMIISMVFISGIDNVLRPFFLKNRIQLHPLIIFFAILGGIFAFGFNGIILGPILVIFFFTVLDLFLIEHKIHQHESADNYEQE